MPGRCCLTCCLTWGRVALATLSLIIVSAPVHAQSTFIRGECNGDGLLNIADAIRILNRFFADGPEFPCRDACDTNDDGILDIADAIFVMSYQFLDGNEPAAPFPDCGDDPTDDGLDCVSTGGFCPPSGSAPTIESVPPTSAVVGEEYSYDVDASDPDPGEALTYSLALAPEGAAIDGRSGLLTWTPSETQLGSQTLIVDVVDSVGLSDQQIFGVMVAAAPQITSPPILAATEGQEYQYDVDAEDLDGPTLTFGLLAFPTGMSIDPASGVITWTPDFDQAGDHSVTVVVSDGDLDDEQSFTVTVANTNRPPTITSTPLTTAAEDAFYTTDIDANDPDGETLTYALTISPAGMAIDPMSGVITWTPAFDQAGSHAVTVVASDGDLDDSQSFTVTVANTNRPPTITSAPITTAAEDALYTTDIDATDPDGEILAYALTVSPAGMAIDPMSGVITWTPSFDQAGDHAVTVVASDGDLDDSQSFTVTVNNTNRPPTITSTPLTTAAEDALYTTDVDATDPDGELLSYALTVSPAGMAIDPMSGVITWTPAFDQAGSHAVTVVASDGDLDDTQSFTVTVANTNRPPTITSAPITTATEDALYTTDVDATDPDGELLTYALTISPTGMAIDPMSGVITWTPDFDQAGDHSVTVVVSDGDLDDTQSFTVTVDNTNRPPTITSAPITAAAEDALYTTDVDATDLDGEILTYALTVSPAGMAIDPMSGVITWTPSFDQAGDHAVTVVASDGDLDDSLSFTVTVDNTNRPPTITSAPLTTAAEDALYTTDVDATDPDGEILTYALIISPAGMAIDPMSGVITWTPAFDQAGSHAVTVVASDGDLDDSQSFTVTVANTNRPPTITSAPITTATEDALYTTGVDATDPDGELLTYALTVSPTGMAIDPMSGVITWTPSFDQAGSHAVTAVASDGDLDDTQSFTVTVTNTNRPPTITSSPPTSGVESAPWTYSVDIDDPDLDDTHTYSLDTAPSGASIDGGGLVNWTPSSGQVGVHPFTVRVTDDAGDFDTQSFDVNVAPLYTVIHRINAGAGAYTDTLGQPWSADTGFNTGSTATTSSSIAGTNDDTLYQSERWDSETAPELTYSLAVPEPGTYLVRLHFAEIWSGITGPGQRVFDVDVEGAPWLSSYDPYVAAGGHSTAVVEEHTVQVSDSAVTLDFFHGVQNPKVSAIEIFQVNDVVDTLVASPSSVDFGSESVGVTSAPTSIVVTAFGSSPITVTDVSVSGDFVLDPLVTPFSLTPGQSTSLEVSFAPTAAGSRLGTLTITHDAPGSPTTVALSGTGVADMPIPPSFSSSLLSGESSNNPTTLQFGPDNRLYVGQQNGLIRIYSIVRNGPNDYSVTATETLSHVRNIPNHNDDGSLATGQTNRQVTGLLVTGTAANPVIYVGSSDPRIVVANPNPPSQSLDTNSGVISRLTWNGSSWDHLQLVRGLPRSEENHANNGMVLDTDTNTLLVAQGGHTNMGAPSTNFSRLPEYALSAAILAIDLDAIGDTTYDLPTLDDEDRPGAIDASDPFGGNDGKNQAILVPGGPVQVYSPGWRNIYDLVLTDTGRLYTVDNGPNGGWGGTPLACSNDFNDGGSTLNDGLHFVSGPGYYGGHPNPTRADLSNTFNPTNPQSPVSVANPIECDYLSPGVENGALATFGSSTNGICEYRASNFGGAMTGQLLTTSFNGAVYRIALNGAGDALAEPLDPIFSGFGSQPLDVTAQRDDQVFPGTVWVAVYGPDTIVCFEPDDYDGTPSPCSGVYDLALDEDGDGYTNADELDNGTNPCSSASLPEDADGDFVSDLNDPDDDDDGLSDHIDTFALDPTNGAGTALPLLLSWNNGDPSPGGILGLGFTGLMTNGQDYAELFDPDLVIAGGAAGVFSIPMVPAGDAQGSVNDQEYAFQLGIPLTPASPSVEVSTRLLSPFSSVTPVDDQSFGIFIGTGSQDEFLSVTAHANGGAGGIAVILETGGTPVGTIHPEPILGAGHIDLTLFVDPAASTVQPRLAIDFGATVDVGPPITVPAGWFNGSDAVAVGVIATSIGATPFPASWDYLRVDPVGTPGSTANAQVEVTITGGINASTYTTGSFRISNLSPSQRITRARIDLAPGMLRDMVYDPLGTAGDLVAKCFTANGGAGTTGLVTPSDPCASAFDVPNDGGYSVVDVQFTDFDPGELFTFSVDVDPSTIQGVAAPGPGDSGSVSGLELTGARVTIEFDDGAVHVSDLFAIAGSVSGSRTTTPTDPSPAPTIEVVGVSSPSLVTLASQTLRITGPANADVRILRVEGATFLAGVPAGGFDVEPFEANSVIQVQHLTANLGAAGTVDVPVTLTRTDTEGGINVFCATIVEGGATGRISNAVTVELAP